MKKYILLFLILVLAFAARWYKIDNPVADWHSWRQADTASVSLEYFKNGIDLLHPKYQDLSSIPSTMDNPEGYRMVEFPHNNALHAVLVKTFMFWNIDVWGRMISVIYSLLSIFFMFKIIESISDDFTAYVAAFFMAVLPFNVYYSRVILPEPLMILLTLISIYSFMNFIKNKKALSYIVSALTLSLALLTKPYAIFFTLPMAYLAFREWRFSLLKKPLTYLYFAITFIPLLMWRDWITNFPEGIPMSAWLYNINGIRLRPAWWRWLFGERIGHLIFGYWGIILFGFGLTKKAKKTEGPFYLLWLIGVFAYLVIFAGGNVTHDYYQAIITPFLIVFLARGFTFLFRSNKLLSWPVSPLLAIFSTGLMLFLSWYHIRGYYQINNWSIVLAGRKADQLLPIDAKVIAPYEGDTAFLYQTRRQGWPAMSKSLEELKKQGATHYVAVNYDETTNQLRRDTNNKILEESDRYIIIELSQE